MTEHSTLSDWWPKVARVEVEHFDTRRAALAAEAAAIWELRPPHNTQYPDLHALSDPYAPPDLNKAVDQLWDEMWIRVTPLARLMGLDPIEMVKLDPIEIEHRVMLTIPVIMAQLTQDDARLATETAKSVMAALWPAYEPPFGWWATDLGRLVARAGGAPETLSRSEAAHLLGKAIGTVKSLVARGDLERDDEGRILTASVLARMDRLEAK